MSRPSYLRRVYRAPASVADDLAACLVAAGALGCELAARRGDDGEAVSLTAWLAAGAPAFDIAPWAGVELVGSDAVEGRDWLAEYRAASQPFVLGRFRIDPRDAAVADPNRDSQASGLIDLRVPAENAFGTGSHESTRLMLRWLEALDLEGLRVLDVGAGSGILSFAALLLGAASAVGFDLDAPSVITARRNARRNVRRDVRRDKVEPRFFAGTAEALGEQPAFDLLMVNVLPERVLGDLPRLVRTLEPGGWLLSSGNLTARRDELLPRFEACGLSRLGEKTDGEWTSFLFGRSASGTAP